MSAGRARLSAWAMLPLLAFALSAHAEWKDSYMRGKRAYEDGDYAKARELLQQALDEHGEPLARFNPYGKVYTPYVPQHYLGLIALKQGDCARAKTLWGSNENRQIILQLPDMAAEEDKAGSGCGAAVAKVEEKPVPLPEKPAEPPPKTVVVAPQAKPVVPPPPPPPPPVNPAVEKPVQIDKTPGEKAPERAPPPDALVQAFDQYLAGRYAEVAHINADAYSDKRARFHALLVRAAAKYTQARIAGDQALLESAKTDVTAAHALDARTTPDATLFSPGFREFYSAGH